MKNKKLPGAKDLYGVTIKVDKSLNKYSGKVLFPKKLEEANEIIRRTEGLDKILGRKKSS